MTPTSTTSHSLVLAVHPTALGFGWVLFDGPRSPVDWGIVRARRKREKKLFARFERIVNRHAPAVLALEVFEGKDAQRRARIQNLYRELIHRARARGMCVRVYRRDAVRSSLSLAGPACRYQVALEVVARIRALDHLAPRVRKAWLSEDPRQSLIDAAALALTYFAVMGED